jgi:hypothetical protein
MFAAVDQGETAAVSLSTEEQANFSVGKQNRERESQLLSVLHVREPHLVEMENSNTIFRENRECCSGLGTVALGAKRKRRKGTYDARSKL